MARLLGPDMGSRMVILPSGTPAAGKLGTVYANAAGTVLADILAYQPGSPTVPGATIAGSVVTTDAYGLLPLFWWPNGVDIVWISVNGGPIVAINADYDARLDAVEAGKVPSTRTITAGTGLTGGGDLTVDRTLTVAYGATVGTAAQGNDARLSDARTPTAHAAAHAVAGSDPVTIAESQVTNLVNDLAAKASTAALNTHLADVANPHVVTKAQVGLGSVDNTADVSKPVSTAQQAALNLKIASALVTAKGDLIAATAASTVTALPVGGNGKALVADAAQASGIGWATIPGGCPLAAGRWYVPSIGTVSTVIPIEGAERAHPLRVGRTCTLTGIAANVTVVGTVGAVLRLGIRADNAGMPGNVLYDSGTIDAVAATGVKSGTPNLAVVEGTIIWLTAVVQGAAGTRPTINTAVSVADPLIGDVSAATALTNGLVAYQATGITGALPNAPAWSATGTAFRVAVTS